MDIFISWSGPKSQAVATALHKWLPQVVNAFKPWLSSADLEKGTRWSSDVAGRLEQSSAGIICLTPGNLHADWILFEAGALSKQVKTAYVCPLLIGLEPSDVEGPLAQFQATKLTKLDLLRLVKTLNTALGDQALAETHVHEAFEVWWSKLEEQLKNLPSDEGEPRPERSERDLLEEILELVRTQSRTLPPLTTMFALEGGVTGIPTGDLINYALRAADPTIKTTSMAYDGTRYLIKVNNGSAQEYEFELPATLTVTELQRAVYAEVKKASAKAAFYGAVAKRPDATEK